MSILKYTPKEREAVNSQEGFVMVDFLVPGWSRRMESRGQQRREAGSFTTGECGESRMMGRASYNMPD